MGAEHFEPRVVNQGSEFIYRYVGDVLEEAKVYQRHRIGYDVANNEGGESIVDGGDGGEAMMMNLEEMKKNSVSVKDVRLAPRVISRGNSRRTTLWNPRRVYKKRARN